MLFKFLKKSLDVTMDTVDRARIAFGVCYQLSLTMQIPLKMQQQTIGASVEFENSDVWVSLLDPETSGHAYILNTAHLT